MGVTENAGDDPVYNDDSDAGPNEPVDDGDGGSATTTAVDPPTTSPPAIGPLTDCSLVQYVYPPNGFLQGNPQAYICNAELPSKEPSPVDPRLTARAVASSLESTPRPRGLWSTPFVPAIHIPPWQQARSKPRPNPLKLLPNRQSQQWTLVNAKMVYTATRHVTTRADRALVPRRRTRLARFIIIVTADRWAMAHAVSEQCWHRGRMCYVGLADLDSESV